MWQISNWTLQQGHAEKKDYDAYTMLQKQDQGDMEAGDLNCEVNTIQYEIDIG